jgi:hypothetical protein
MIQFDRCTADESINGRVHGTETGTAKVRVMAQASTGQGDRAGIVQEMLSNQCHVDLMNSPLPIGVKAHRYHPGQDRR